MSPPEPPSDDTTIEEVVRSLYEAISFADEAGPDFDRLTELFAPGARLIEVKPEGTEILDLMTFIDRAIELLRGGRITRFHEREVWQRIDQFGHMAHVLSTYEARDRASDEKPLARGVNSIQLVRDAEGWRVVTILWQNEGAGDEVPPGFLPG